jgi:ABC-2 type transport system permease protein
MSLYGRIAWFNFATYLAYPIELAAAVVRPVFEFGFVILFWSIVAASSRQAIQINGLISYFLLATGMSDLLLLSGVKFGSFLAKEIKRGKLSNALIKPVNPLLYEFSQLLGNRGVSTVVAIIFVALGLIVQPPSSWLSVGLFLIYLPIAAIISISLNILVGTVAFYSTESSAIKNVASHMIQVFSGALVPLYLFPETLKTVVSILPFTTAVYGPVHALQTTTITTEVWMGLGSGLVWSVLLLWLALFIWRKGLKKYEAIGI